jgi:hypothetical protein
LPESLVFTAKGRKMQNILAVEHPSLLSLEILLANFQVFAALRPVSTPLNLVQGAKKSI